MDQPAQVNWLDTTPDERTMATLAHALQLIGSWIAPLIIFLVRRRSRFVAFHALQALLLQIVHTILVIGLAIGIFITVFASVVPGIQSNPHGQPPVALLLVFPLVWVCIFAMSIGVLAIAIIYAIKAGRGEWADYPVLGKLARKILKMEPIEGRIVPPPPPQM
jgi:uncharacterized membrane protein